MPLYLVCAALLTVALVYWLARVGRSLPTTYLILAGVAVSSFATALTSFIMINATGEIRRAVIWLLGGATLSGWQPVPMQWVLDAWELQVHLPPGPQRVAVRVNGSQWRAPANLTKVTDEFGGEAGLVVVP